MRTLPLFALLALLGILGTLPAVAQETTGAPGEDAVVIAVVDSGFSPYNLNFRAAGMPQHLDGDSDNDLPLNTDPADWLPGYTVTEDATAAGPITLTLDDEGDATIEELEAQDDPSGQMQTSTSGAVNVHWIPGTKIIGAVNFGSSGNFFATNDTHGNGTSSVAAGNQVGTCPECLVVLVRYGSGDDREAASNWAMSQPWIDVVTNSFGFSTVMRDRIYDGADTELQRQASERGQTIFFSAGNGQANTFTVPNTTIQSSQEGPDWIITVGGTDPDGGNYTGAGKPADMASIGTDYEAGYGEDTTQGEGTFGGTSNATPVSAGTYARALWEIRQAMAGPSRTQADGIVASGELPCGSVVADCATADGELTVSELRFAFLQSLERTPEGLYATYFVGVGDPLPAYAETEFAAEGHGTLFGRLNDDDNWLEELAGVVGPLTGTQEPLERTQEERDWMIVDSYCRQEVHGTWDGGYYIEGETELPPMSGPLQSLMQEGCPTVFGLLKDAGATPAPTAEGQNLDPQ